MRSWSRSRGKAVPKKQQHTTLQSVLFVTRKNTQSAQLTRSPLTSLQPNGGTGATTADPTEQAAVDKEEGEVLKPKQTASEAGVDILAKSGRHGRAEQSMN